MRCMFLNITFQCLSQLLGIQLTIQLQICLPTRHQQLQHMIQYQICHPIHLHQSMYCQQQRHVIQYLICLHTHLQIPIINIRIDQLPSRQTPCKAQLITPLNIREQAMYKMIVSFLYNKLKMKLQKLYT